MDNSNIHDLLKSFWDWMHSHWTYASHRDGCASSQCDEESFKEDVYKFIKEMKKYNAVDKR